MKVQRRTPGSDETYRFQIIRYPYNYHLHLHQFVELGLMLDGELLVTVGGRTETARSGSFFLIFPFQPHSYSASSDTTLILYTFSPFLLSDFLKKIERKVGAHSVFDASPISMKLFTERALYEGKNTDAAEYGVRCALYSMLYDFTTQVPLTDARADTNVLSQLLQHLNDHFREPLPLKEVARAIGYNEKYLSHTIQHACGFNYSTLLSYIRTENAKALLTETKKSVSEIAMESGFGSERSFHRQFRQITGVSPREYRHKGPLRIVDYAPPKRTRNTADGL